MKVLRKVLVCCIALILATATLGGCAPQALKENSSERSSDTEERYATSPDSGSSTSPKSEESTGSATPYSARPSDSQAPAYSDDSYYYEPYNSEEYAKISEKGFISTLAHPLSTFSADVDTASYCNLRRMINEGKDLESIPSDAVRIEEMLNYFDYNYPTPGTGELFGVSSQVADCPWNPDTKLLIMGFATEATDYSKTEGSNLVFLIDTSGSMSSKDKLPLLQESFATLVEQLNDDDLVSIVTYSGEEKVICEGVPGSDKKGLTRAINSLVASGSTNGEAGLQKAYKLAERYFIEGGNNRIIMASDGDLNVGISSTDELHEYVSEKRETGVYLSVLGFGTGNYKDSKMEVLADNGNGSYHYIDCQAEAQKVFEKDLCANLVTLAKDVKLQVEFNPDQVKGYRLIGYENRAMANEDFDNAAADAGEIGWGHQITVAYELVMPDSPIDVPLPELKYRNNEPAPSKTNEWLTCSIRYKAPDTDKGYENRYTVDASSYTTRPNNDWNFAAAVIETGLLLRDSEYGENASFKQVAELLENSNCNDREKKEFATLVSYLDYPSQSSGRGYYYD